MNSRRLILLLLIVSVSVSMTSCLFIGICGNDELSRTTSPDGKMDAVSFRRNCGATTSFSLHISIIPSGRRIKNEKKGNIYISDYCDTQFYWISDSELVIEKMKIGEVYKSENRFRKISIDY